MGDVIDFSGRRVGPAQAGNVYRAFKHSDYAEQYLFFVFHDTNRYLILRFAELERISSVPGVDSNRAVLLRFTGSDITEVRLDGHRLLELVSDLRFHQVSLIREAPPKWDGYRDDVVSVIRITVQTVKR